MEKNGTSWEKAAKWYDELLESEGTYQKDLILPNLLRMMEIEKTDVVLDLACGQGFFSREFKKKAKKVIGADLSPELIKIAESKSAGVEYHAVAADKLDFLEDGSIDKISVILALQNMADIGSVFSECRRVLRQIGRLYFVLNHPAFRIPKVSSWGWDPEKQVQYRRVDAYISESRAAIQTHPGSAPEERTWSFHRPLQVYFKALARQGFAVLRLEEWNSDKKSEPGPRQKAEDKARKEIPLFMAVEAIRI
ncbi:MAG: class I SAM-dependent methyltransferase [Patescibacteria group bacterium]|nr:class I SAM-dependent methyltransferase [Patescibacteria group bacterium]MCL5261830.1 class I SAM-dependent methyltransferase [Patescibacteria group bacterium]